MDFIIGNATKHAPIKQRSQVIRRRRPALAKVHEMIMKTIWVQRRKLGAGYHSSLPATNYNVCVICQKDTSKQKRSKFKLTSCQLDSRKEKLLAAAKFHSDEKVQLAVSTPGPDVLFTCGQVPLKVL